MFTHSSFVNIIAQAELALFEVRELNQGGPRLRIVHRFHKTGVDCSPGEEVVAVFLLDGAHEILLPMSLSTRLLFNYLSEWRRIPQSATQIAMGIHASPFYARHGLNGGSLLRRRISRTGVKEYIKRIRKALALALASATLSIGSEQVLTSVNTTGNEVLYRLRATVEWVHLD